MKEEQYSEIKWIEDPASERDINSKLTDVWVLLGIEQSKEGDGEGSWIRDHTKYILGKKIVED